MGIHTGSCKAGLISTNTKIPYFAVVGEAVEVAKLMEKTGEPMKVQVQLSKKLKLKLKIENSLIRSATNN